MADGGYARKVVVLGFPGVGKSSLSRQFVERRFSPDYEPTIVSSMRKVFKVDSTTFNIEIVDTAGQDEHSRIPQEASLGVHGYVLLFSVTSRNSFEKLQLVNDTLLDAIGVDTVPRVLVGNKVDLKRQVPEAEARELAARWGCPYLETSAALNENVDLVFERLLRVIEKDSGLLKPKKEASKSLCAIL